MKRLTVGTSFVSRGGSLLDTTTKALRGFHISLSITAHFVRCRDPVKHPDDDTYHEEEGFTLA